MKPNIPVNIVLWEYWLWLWLYRLGAHGSREKKRRHGLKWQLRERKELGNPHALNILNLWQGSNAHR